jgi:hypothetical protein
MVIKRYFGSGRAGPAFQQTWRKWDALLVGNLKTATLTYGIPLFRQANVTGAAATDGWPIRSTDYMARKKKDKLDGICDTLTFSMWNSRRFVTKEFELTN